MKKGIRYILSLITMFIPLIPIPVFANQSVTDAETASGPAAIWIIAAFTAGMIAGGLLIYLYSRWKIYSVLSAERNKYLHDLREDRDQDILTLKFFRHLGIISLLKKSKDKKNRLVDSQNRKISELKTQNEKLRRENKRMMEASAHEKDDQSHHNIYVEQDEISGNKTELYFTIPESDGSFKDTNARKEREIDCFYMIEPDDDCQGGKLHFIPGNYDLRALDNIDYYLSPVCEIQNISDRSKARKIQMTGPGSVIKRGGRWIIDTKDKVKIKLVE